MKFSTTVLVAIVTVSNGVLSAPAAVLLPPQANLTATPANITSAAEEAVPVVKSRAVLAKTPTDFLEVPAAINSTLERKRSSLNVTVDELKVPHYNRALDKTQAKVSSLAGNTTKEVRSLNATSSAPIEATDKLASLTWRQLARRVFLI